MFPGVAWQLARVFLARVFLARVFLARVFLARSLHFTIGNWVVVQLWAAVFVFDDLFNVSSFDISGFYIPLPPGWLPWTVR